jgi:hypothetical protein
MNSPPGFGNPVRIHLHFVRVPLRVTLQRSPLVNGSISMAVKFGRNGAVQIQTRVLYGVRNPLKNYPDLI